MKRRKPLLALLAASVISAVALMMPTAASAATGTAGYGQSVVHLSDVAGGSGVSPADEHNCVSPGNDGVTRAVFCADFIYYQTAQAEGMCQTMSTGVIVQCPLIELHYGLAVAGPGQVETEYAACPHNGHPCPEGRFTVNDEGQSSYFSCGVEMWTVVNATSEIELPSHRVITLGSNFASAHGVSC